MRKLLWIPLVSGLFFYSCSGCSNLPIPEHPVPVGLDVVFSQEMRIDPNENIILEGNVAYLTSRNDMRVYAYNVDTHTLLWTCDDPFFSKSVDYTIEYDAVVSTDSVYVFMFGMPYMARIDKASGARLGVHIFEGKTKSRAKSIGRIFKDGVIIISEYDYTLMWMDPSLAVKTHSNPDLYNQPFSFMPLIEPYMNGSYACSLYKDSILVSPYAGEFEGGTDIRGDLVLLDYDTKAILWRIRDYTISNCPFAIAGNKLYATTIEYETQAPVFLIVNMDNGDIIKKLPRLSAPDGAPTISGDNVFVMSSAYNDPEYWEGVDNLYCFSLTTDEIKWTRPYIEGEAYGNQPQENHGILYMPCYDRIKLFDAETGEYLGYDNSLKGDHWGMEDTIKYGDLMLLSDGSRFYGFKMNYAKGENGLEKLPE